MQEVHVLIVGGGLSGISAAVHLLEAGERDLVLLEREAELGGVWRDNTYPGCACDIPSHVYSYTFAPNREWSRTYGERSEIQEYLLGVAKERGVRDLVRFNAEVLEATWQEDKHRWIVRTSDSLYAARILVLATGGPLSEPAVPDLPGLEQFEGTVFHSARWRNDHDLAGRRVAVVGTGASAIQIVPAIQPLVSHLTLLQRTPAWVLPKNDRAVGRVQKAVLRVPGGLRLIRGTRLAFTELSRFGFKHPRLLRPMEKAARKHLEERVPSPELRAKLTPSYKLGCKRVLFSSNFYDALTKDNVDVVPWGLSEVRGRSVVAADGSEHPVDTIIFATGFQALTAPITRRVTGRFNKTIAQVWDGRPKAFKATSVAGFPNAFYLFGPNSALASAFMMAEAQSRYLVEAVKAMRRQGLTMIDVRESAQDDWKRATDEALSTQIWSTGCTSYYLDVDGKNATIYPRGIRAMRRELSRFPLEAYETGVMPDSRR
jgi:cation diffusion facilitator CzcD-associated flavoprotein CzcO